MRVTAVGGMWCSAADGLWLARAEELVPRAIAFNLRHILANLDVDALV